jgi:hypothetical protein
MGWAKFKVTHLAGVSEQLKHFLNEGKQRLVLNYQEGKSVLLLRQNPQKNAAVLKEKDSYKSQFDSYVRIITANNWRLVKTGKAGAFILKLQLKVRGLHWFQKNSGSLQWWWSKYLEILRVVYRRHVQMIDVTYKAIRFQGIFFYRKSMKGKVSVWEEQFAKMVESQVSRLLNPGLLVNNWFGIFGKLAIANYENFMENIRDQVDKDSQQFVLKVSGLYKETIEEPTKFVVSGHSAGGEGKAAHCGLLREMLAKILAKCSFCGGPLTQRLRKECGV